MIIRCYTIATIKVAGTLQRSGEVMKLVNQLVRLPELSQTMQQMSMEMTKVNDNNNSKSKTSG